MNVRDALERVVGGEGRLFHLTIREEGVIAEIASKIERALIAAYNNGYEASRISPTYDPNNGVDAGVAAMTEGP